jgi:acyl-CoA thioesterase
MKKYADWK